MRSPPASWLPGLYPVRGFMSVPHVLADADGVVVLDTGLPGDGRRIRRVLDGIGAGPRDVRAILLTHGHLDHAGSVAALQEWSGAPVYAHPLEQEHIDGVYPYTGLTRVCEAMEATGRAVLGYRAVPIDVPLADGDELPFWGGLRVVHLPGHTRGHCGFHAAKRDVLFTGDLWVRFLMRTQLTPRIFTTMPEAVLPSLRRARAIGARWVVPGHYDLPGARQLKARFENVCDEVEHRRARRV